MRRRMICVLALVACAILGQAQTLSVSPSSLSFTGQAQGVLPPVQPLTVTNTGLTAAEVDIHIVDGVPWLYPLGLYSIPIAPGASYAFLIQASTYQVPAVVGAYDSAITVSTGANPPQVIPVHFAVSAAATTSISLSTNSITFTVPAYTGLTDTGQNVTIVNTSNAAVLADSTGTPAWMQQFGAWLAPLSSAGNEVYVDTTFLKPGTYNGVINITGAANGPQQLAYHATVTAPPAGVPTFAAVVNAASYALAGVAPGQIVSIFGANLGPATAVAAPIDGSSAPTTLAGVQVLFGAISAPLLYVQAGQVNTIVPQFPLDPSGVITVQVNYENTASTPFPVAYSDRIAIFTGGYSLANAAIDAPGIFTVDSSGQGHAIILNQDGTLNSTANPAARGTTVSVYATGLGPTNPAATDGQFVTMDMPAIATPLVGIGAPLELQGTQATVVYSGLVPGFFNGVYRVDFVVPTQIAVGADPISIGFLLPPGRYGPQYSESQPGVIISIK